MGSNCATFRVNAPTTVEDFWREISRTDYFIDGEDRDTERRQLRGLDAFLTQWFRDHPNHLESGEGPDPMRTVWLFVATLARNAERQMEEAGELDTAESLPTPNRVQRCERRPHRKRLRFGARQDRHGPCRCWPPNKPSRWHR